MSQSFHSPWILFLSILLHSDNVGSSASHQTQPMPIPVFALLFTMVNVMCVLTMSGQFYVNCPTYSGRLIDSFILSYLFDCI